MIFSTIALFNSRLLAPEKEESNSVNEVLEMARRMRSEQAEAMANKYAEELSKIGSKEKASGRGSNDTSE